MLESLNIEQERAAFEAAAAEKGMHDLTRAPGGDYLRDPVSICWSIWQDRAQLAQQNQEPVAELAGMDEYGPRLHWFKHWVDVEIGTQFFAASQEREENLPLDLPESVIDATAEAIGKTYYCKRVWSAWSYGTMTEDDFELLAEDRGLVTDVAKAAIDAYISTTAAGRHPDDAAVDRFASEMKMKLAKKREQGYGGWDDPKYWHWPLAESQFSQEGESSCT